MAEGNATEFGINIVQQINQSNKDSNVSKSPDNKFTTDINKSSTPEKHSLTAENLDEHHIKMNIHTPPNSDVSHPENNFSVILDMATEGDNPLPADAMLLFMQFLKSKQETFDSILGAGDTGEDEKDTQSLVNTIQNKVVSRRSFLGGLTAVAGAAVAYNHPFILGKLAKFASKALGKSSVRQVLAEKYPMRAIVTEYGDLNNMKETAYLPIESLSFSAESDDVENIQQNGDTILAIKSHNIKWSTENSTIEDKVYAYTNPKNGKFNVKGASACAWKLDGKEVASLQVPVVLDLILRRNSLRQDFNIHSYNRQGILFPGMAEIDNHKPPTDYNGLTDLTHPMHTAASFLTLHSGETPTAVVNPTWCAQSCMTFANTATSENPMSVLEYLPYSSRQAFWNPDLFSKWSKLNSVEKRKFLELEKSMATERWSDVKKENYADPMFHRILRINSDGSVFVQNDSDFSADLDGLMEADSLDGVSENTATPKSDQFLKENGFVKPVFIVNADRQESLPQRENDPTNIALNMAVVAKDKDSNKSHIIAILTANQRRRFTMDQLHKIGNEWLKSQNLSQEDVFFIGLDEHGGGEVSSISNNKN